jgi:N-acetylglucosamine-6-sulfatase
MEMILRRTIAVGIAVALLNLGPVAGATHSTRAHPRLNVVVIITDDQRWDKITPTYMPNVYRRFVKNGTAFTNSFVPNPLCCPSRASILTGNYSHTTGVWSNEGRYGGFRAFGNQDQHTVAVDFNTAGYRTAMIGKYLNGYFSGTSRYVPPGWDKWFSLDTGAYYNYGVSSNGRLLYYGYRPQDYVTRVLSDQAVSFVTEARVDGAPFFLYYAFTAPHGPSIPDPRDIRRFARETGGAGRDNMLESAYGTDRAIGRLLRTLPPHTLVVFMSDNGYLWGEVKDSRGRLGGKFWPYNESIRVPIYMASLDGSYTPVAGLNDLVLNVDLRTTLTHAAGLSPRTRTEGIDLGGARYKARWVFPLEHIKGMDKVPTYCGARTIHWMYVRYRGGTEELYAEPSAERVNLVGAPGYWATYHRMKTAARRLCHPAPPGYRWG